MTRRRQLTLALASVAAIALTIEAVRHSDGRWFHLVLAALFVATGIVPGVMAWRRSRAR